MYWNSGKSEQALPMTFISGIVIPALTIFTIILGFHPDPIFWLLGA